MKIAVRFGHQLTGEDGGAVGIVKETDVNRRYGPKVIEKLKALGHTVINVTPPEAHRTLADSLNYGINLANSNNVDLFVSCHVNAATPTNSPRGCEVVCSGSGKGLEYAKKVVNELSALGFKNRGAKADERGLAEIRRTSMPCVIIEPFFLDSSADVAIYNKVGDEGIANAIVKGITGKTSNNTAPVVNNVVASAPVQKSSVSTGDSTVKIIQQQLNAVTNARLAVDGIMGPNTIAKIKELQIVAGIAVDGKWGPQSAGVIGEIYSKPIIRIGSRGIAVRVLQFRLGIQFDGIFGNQTVGKLIQYQKNNGLAVDAICGPQTWSKLLGL